MKFLLILLFVFGAPMGFAQCPDEGKAWFGGDFGHHEFISFCPSYDFAEGGATATRWSILNPIDIRQAAPAVLSMKQAVEQKIRAYAGESFFSRLSFSSVRVVYLDSIAQFSGFGAGINLARCKCKYFLTYYFRPVSAATSPKAAYCVGIAVDEQGTILSPFTFPSEQDYQPVEPTLTVCEVIARARQFAPKLGPIAEVRFEYDSSSKRFYWLVEQEVTSPKRGENIFTQIVIDAANPAQVKAQKARSYRSQ